MPQLFPKWSNVLSRVGLLSLPLLFAGGAVTGAAFYRSDYTTGAREVVCAALVLMDHPQNVAQVNKYAQLVAIGSA